VAKTVTWLTAADLAALAGISVQAVHAAIREGRIQGNAFSKDGLLHRHRALRQLHGNTKRPRGEPAAKLDAAKRSMWVDRCDRLAVKLDVLRRSLIPTDTACTLLPLHQSIVMEVPQLLVDGFSLPLVEPALWKDKAHALVIQRRNFLDAVMMQVSARMKATGDEPEPAESIGEKLAAQLAPSPSAPAWTKDTTIAELQAHYTDLRSEIHRVNEAVQLGKLEPAADRAARYLDALQIAIGHLKGLDNLIQAGAPEDMLERLTVACRGIAEELAGWSEPIQ
jgi:hypothetical protein